MDDAEYQVKQHPLSTVGISFSIGVGLGAVIGILGGRESATQVAREQPHA